MSCSASDAAAGSPEPPTDDQVARSNWYLPRYRPPPPMAAGLPPDSQAAIACSAGGTATARYAGSCRGRVFGADVSALAGVERATAHSTPAPRVLDFTGSGPPWR